MEEVVVKDRCSIGITHHELRLLDTLGTVSSFYFGSTDIAYSISVRRTSRVGTCKYVHSHDPHTQKSLYCSQSMVQYNTTCMKWIYFIYAKTMACVCFCVWIHKVNLDQHNLKHNNKKCVVI